jgi:hypothetical protein
MPDDELRQRLLADAEHYDPAAHTRSLLAPYRQVLLLQRAKYMSYEQISATLARHGITVSPTAIGVFCRRYLTKAEIERARHPHLGKPAPAATPDQLPGLGTTTNPPPPAPPRRRGPNIARDDL